MSTWTFRRSRRPAAATTSAATNSAAIASPSGKPSAAAESPASTASVPGQIAPEVERVREERIAAIAASGAQGDRRPHGVDRDHEPDRRERPPGRVHLGLDRTGQASDREAGDQDADEDQERGLGERREMLGLPVAPRMSGVRGANRDRDGEEREQRGREVRARVRGLREQPEAPAREPGRELDRDQQARGPDRDERRAALG